MNYLQHKQECYSGTAPWNKCFCDIENKEREKFPCTACDKSFGTKQGRLVHFSMIHKDEII